MDSNVQAWMDSAPPTTPEETKSFNAGDKEQVNEKRKKHGRKTARQKNIVLELMQTTQAREYFYSLLEFCHIWNLTFDAENQYISSFREGERNIGLKVLSDIMAASPDLYLQMCKEAEDAKK